MNISHIDMYIILIPGVLMEILICFSNTSSYLPQEQRPCTCPKIRVTCLSHAKLDFNNSATSFLIARGAMEKFSQFRDRGKFLQLHASSLLNICTDSPQGSGIAPFLPIPSEPLGLRGPLRLFLFWLRLPLFIFVTLSYFMVLQWLPIGSLGKKAALWCILGVPSIWWIDLQVDGVRKG